MRMLEAQNAEISKQLQSLMQVLSGRQVSRSASGGDEAVPQRPEVPANTDASGGLSKLQAALAGVDVPSSPQKQVGSPSMGRGGVISSALASDVESELVLRSLLCNGPVPLDQVKRKCKYNQPRISWDTAKRVRRQMNVTQYKQLTKEGEVVRMWKLP